MAAKTLEQDFQAPADAVWNALQATAQQMAKQIDSVDTAQRTIYFNTGLSWSSWTGQNVTASVSEAEPGVSRLNVQAQLARRGLSSVQLITWGEEKRVARKVVDGVRRQLG